MPIPSFFPPWFVHLVGENVNILMNIVLCIRTSPTVLFVIWLFCPHVTIICRLPSLQLAFALRRSCRALHITARSAAPSNGRWHVMCAYSTYWIPTSLWTSSERLCVFLSVTLSKCLFRARKLLNQNCSCRWTSPHIFHHTSLSA